MDLDYTGLWSWTLPLWGLFIFVFFLGGVLTTPTVLQGVQTGGAAVTAAARLAKKHVRWAADV